MKLKKLLTGLLLFTGIMCGYSQEKYITKSGHISFFSSTPVEDIQADNKQVLSIVDTTNGKVAIAILMKSFLFDKSLMQEHFNENYVESDRYPKAIFKGDITNLNAVLTGAKEAIIKGSLNLHGVSKPITVTSAYITKDTKGILLKGNFAVKPADFNIKIPSVVQNNIANEVVVSFELNHEPFKTKK